MPIGRHNYKDSDFFLLVITEVKQIFMSSFFITLRKIHFTLRKIHLLALCFIYRLDFLAVLFFCMN